MATRSGIVIAGDLDVRTNPSKRRRLVCVLPRGSSVEILDHRNGWYEVESELGRGWVGSRFIAPSSRDLVTDYLWQIEALRTAALEAPAEQQLGVPADGSLAGALAATWNQYGGLIGELCNVVSIDPACVLAVLHIESGGRGWGPDGRLIIRFENHLFRQFLGDARADVFDAHFRFDPNTVWQNHFFCREGEDWQPCHQDQAEEWTVLEFARGLDDEAALLSISMGMPQIMGFNHALIGYPSVREMFDRFGSDIRYQILGMFDFIRGHGDTSPMLEALRVRNYEAFAMGYNGGGQAAFYGGLIRGAAGQFEQLRGGRPPSIIAGDGTYTVRPGDSLGAIAARLGVSMEALASANGIANPDLIAVGQVLHVPGAAAPPPPPEPAPEGGGEETYAVQPGDMLSRIAARFGVTMEALAALNGITNPDRIEVGQVLRIPSRDRSMRRPRGGARRRAPAIEFVPYSVLPGDTLRNVATAQGVTVEALAAANEVHLAPGQLLAIPRG